MNTSKLTIRNLKAFERSPKTRQLRAAIIAARIFAKVTREHVDSYAEPFRIAYPGMTERFGDWFRKASEQEIEAYFSALHVEHIKNGYRVEEVGVCPALMAEETLRQAEHALIEFASEWFGFDFNLSITRLYREALALFENGPEEVRKAA